MVALAAVNAMGNPADTESTRELAAIMFSDIAGYTLIMGRDEAKAIRALSEYRELLRSLLPKFKRPNAWRDRRRHPLQLPQRN